MRYLSLSGLVVVAGALTAFACGDSDSGSGTPSSVAGDAGDSGDSVAGKAGSAGKGGGGNSTAGKGGGGNSTAGKGGGGNGTAGKGGGDNGGTSGGVNVAGAAAIGGEAGEGGGGGAPAVTESLTVTVSGVPSGATASVTITGPDNYSKVISATTTLTDVEPGSYMISATSLRVAGTQVDSQYDPTITGGTVSVVSGEASTAKVTYGLRGGTGSMWVTNFSDHKAFAFGASTLAKTGDVNDTPKTTLTMLNDVSTQPTDAIAFSKTGDLWAGTCQNGITPQALEMFPPSKLSATSSPQATVTITLPSDSTYDCVGALTFDAAGNLWVGMYHGHILRFDAKDLLTDGSPEPSVNLTDDGTYFFGVFDMAFDKDGNLLVASIVDETVSRLSASQLTQSSAAFVPDVALTFDAYPGGIALDGNGNLWVADYGSGGKGDGRILKVNAADMTTSGAPTPAVIITGLPGPEWLQFDNAGNLWVTGYDNNTIFALGAADLATGGAKTPLTTLKGGGSLSLPFGLRFNPSSP